MIGLMSKNFTKALKAAGYINVLPYKGWNTYNISNICTESPFKIVYMGNEFAETQRLFDCVLTLTSKFMVVKDIDITKESVLAEVENKSYLKSLSYTWLNLSIGALERFGTARKKTKMSIRCNLPGIADIMLERGYRRIHRDGDRKLEYSMLFDEIRDSSRFVGLKNLE